MIKLPEKHKMLEKFNKLPKRKLVGKRYLVDTSNAFFWNRYVSVQDMESNTFAMAHGPSILHDDISKGKISWKKSSEMLYIWLNTPKKCKDFIAGKVTKVSKGQLQPTYGSNKVFYSYK